MRLALLILALVCGVVACVACAKSRPESDALLADGARLRERREDLKKRWQQAELPGCEPLGLAASAARSCANARMAFDRFKLALARGESDEQAMQAALELAQSSAEATRLLRRAATERALPELKARDDPFLTVVNAHTGIATGALQALGVFLQFGPREVRRRAIGSFEGFARGYPEFSIRHTLLEAELIEADPEIRRRIVELSKSVPSPKQRAAQPRPSGQPSANRSD